MAQSDSTLVGVFPDQNQAEQAIHSLHSHGFPYESIGFAVRGATGEPTSKTEHGFVSNDTAGGIGAGMVTGAGLGGLVAAGASLLIPGFGPVIAAGILGAVLGGVAIGAAAGGIIGALTSMGIPEEEARYYQGELEQGRVLVTVDAGGRASEARGILMSHGAYDVDRAGDVPIRGWDEMSGTFQDRWQTRFGASGGRWEDDLSYYRYGYEMANDPRYAGRDWNDIEPELRLGYGSWATRNGYSHGESTWNRFKDRVQDAWEDTRGRRIAA